MGDKWEKTPGDAGDVQNVNPYSNNTYDFLQKLASGQNLRTEIGALAGISPWIQGISETMTSPYAGNRLALAEQMAAENQRNTAAQFANLGGGVHSGGFVSAMTQGGAQPYMQAVTDIAGMGTGISNNLLQGMMGLQQAGMAGMTNMSNPEYWQPTYIEKKGAGSKFMDFFTALTSAIPSMFA